MFESVKLCKYRTRASGTILLVRESKLAVWEKQLFGNQRATKITESKLTTQYTYIAKNDKALGQTIGSSLLRDLKIEYDYGTFQTSPDDFKILLELVEPYIMKSDTNYRRAIPLAERLAVTRAL
nr:unnamed protein product [Callosobruchus analis]